MNLTAGTTHEINAKPYECSIINFPNFGQKLSEQKHIERKGICGAEWEINRWPIIFYMKIFDTFHIKGILGPCIGVQKFRL
jgi:hypothetical protein